MSDKAQSFIQALRLQAHPEGGYYRETYRSDRVIDVPGAGGVVPRNISTGIYFLLEKDDFSAFHRIKSDEMWHFYAGQALEVIELQPTGELLCTRLGNDIGQGCAPQHVVPANTWFAARVAPGGEFALVGCSVAPGFDFADFELAQRAALSDQFPQHRQIIAGLTR